MYELPFSRSLCFAVAALHLRVYVSTVALAGARVTMLQDAGWLIDGFELTVQTDRQGSQLADLFSSCSGAAGIVRLNASLQTACKKLQPTCIDCLK